VDPAAELITGDSVTARAAPPLLALLTLLAACSGPESPAPDGTPIHYRVYGQGEPAIVFIHGWSVESGRKDWSMASFGADVAAVIRDAGLGRVMLVGSSMGGTVPLMAGLRADFPKTVSEFVGGNFFTGQSDPILKKWIVEDMAAAPPGVAIPAMESLLAMDYGPLLAALDLPVVAMNAAGSPTDEAAIRRLEPRFRVVALEGVGHFPMLEQPQVFNRVLERIVSEWTRLESERNRLSVDTPAG